MTPKCLAWSSGKLGLPFSENEKPGRRAGLAGWQEGVDDGENNYWIFVNKEHKVDIQEAAARYMSMDFNREI